MTPAVERTIRSNSEAIAFAAGPASSTPERVAIVGSRACYWRDDASLARTTVRSIIVYLHASTTVISGDSPGGGVDWWARSACEAIEQSFRAHWPGTYTKQGMPFGAACFRRNTDIAEDCTRLIAVCPTRTPTRGTLDTMKKARAMGKRVTLVVVSGGEVTAEDWEGA